MLRTVSWLACASCLLSAAAQGQYRPCDDQFHCGEDAYCDLDKGMCRKCLSCHDFQRKPPETPTDCIKSIIECGSCVEGDAACSGESTSYVWIAVAVGLVLLAVLIIVMLFALNRNLSTLKIRARQYFNVCPAASASLQPSRPPDVSPESPPPPPPYAPYDTAPQPYASAPPTEYVRESEYDSDYHKDGSDRPFITRDTKGRVPGATESDASHRTVPYSTPSYVRQHPSSPDALEPYAASQQPPATAVHSEDIGDGTVANGNAADVSDTRASNARMSDARTSDARVSDAPAASRQLQPFHQDSNNNNNGGGEGRSPPAAPSPPAAGLPSVLINMNVNMMNTQQNIKNVSVNMQQNNQ